MEPVVHAASMASAGAVSHLVSAIWEGCILAAVVAVCLRMLPRLSAAARSLVWMNVFLLLVLLPVLPEFRGHGTGVWPARVAALNLDLRWSLAIAGVWAALSLWRGTQLMVSAMRLRGLAKRAMPMEGEHGIGDDAIRELLAEGPRGRRAELCTSDEVARPSVIGFFRPRILLPPALAERLSPLELRQVVLHEMEHLRRADDWTNLLQKIALVVFPLNPVLMWVEHRLCAERELACDDRVLLSSGARRAYAVCLTRLAEYSMLRRSLSLALGAWERRPELVRRVHRLLRSPSQAMGSVQAKLVTATLMVGVLIGALTLARSPQLVAFDRPASLMLAPSADGSVTHGSMLASTAAIGDGFRAVSARQIMTPAAAPARLVETRAVLPAQPLRRARVKAAKLQRPPSDQNWMVLTEWTDAATPPRAVMTVFQTRGGSYAAVPFMNGWLIVQI
jgi:beta-lactamase regulating signal transducer with metallopeptidase domain